MLVTRPANISKYDFRRPNKLNREHIRALEIVGETFARQVTTVLATSLRCPVSTKMEEIGQLTYDELVRELPAPTMLTVLDMPPLKGAAMMHLPSELTMGIIERLLGGKGGNHGANRAPTEIEMRLITTLLDRILEKLGYAFEAIMVLRPSINRTETNPQFAQVTSPTDMIITMPFTLMMDGIPTQILFAVPFTMLAPVLDEATNRNRLDDDGLAHELRLAVEGSVNTATMEVIVRFDEVVMASKKIADLRPGDILPLDQPLDSPLTVEVAGLPRFRATAGTKGKRVACLVTETNQEV